MLLYSWWCRRPCGIKHAADHPVLIASRFPDGRSATNECMPYLGYRRPVLRDCVNSHRLRRRIGPFRCQIHASTLFVIGMKMVVQGGIDHRKALIAGVAFWVGECRREKRAAEFHPIHAEIYDLIDQILDRAEIFEKAGRRGGERSVHPRRDRQCVRGRSPYPSPTFRAERDERARFRGRFGVIRRRNAVGVG